MRLLEPDEGLQAFLNKALDHPLLTADQEKLLARASKRGGPDAERARLRLIECNLRLVISIARYHRNRGLGFDDVIQEGILGLDRASRKFDPERGFRFSTYATLWIRQSIQRGLQAAGTTIRLPSEVAARRAKARGLIQRSGRDYTVEELAEELDMDVEQVRQALYAAEVVVSLDRQTPAADDDSAGSLYDTVACPHSPDPYDVLPTDVDYLYSALAELTDTQRQVIELRFGFDGAPARSLDEVAAEMGVGITKVQTAQREALKVLRGLLQSELV